MDAGVGLVRCNMNCTKQQSECLKMWNVIKCCRFLDVDWGC